jgi:cysteine desulfurase
MIYLDNNATTQPTAHVVEAMLPYLTECYFNASASTAAFTGADKPRGEAAAAMARLLNAEEPDSRLELRSQTTGFSRRLPEGARLGAF